MKDTIRIVESLKDSGLFLKGVSETIQNEAKMLPDTLGTSLLRHFLIG